MYRVAERALPFSRPDPTLCLFFFFNDTATTEIYTLSLHDALPILPCESPVWRRGRVLVRHEVDMPTVERRATKTTCTGVQRRDVEREPGRCVRPRSARKIGRAHV